MKKKIISLLTTLVMVVGLVGVMPAVSVGAVTSGDVVISIVPDTDYAYVGEEVTYTIAINTSQNLGTLQMRMELPENLYYVEGSFVVDENINVNLGWDSDDYVSWAEQTLFISGFNGTGSTSDDIADRTITLGTFSVVSYDAETYTPEFVEYQFTNTNYDELTYRANVTPISYEEYDYQYYDDYTYLVLDNGTVEITGYTGDATELEIPDTINGMEVTSIGEEAFAWNSNLTSVTISGNVASIGDDAFWYCSSLTSITILNGVTSIGDSAFSLCANLTSVTIPDSVTSIGDFAFYWCISLTSMIIPSSVEYIGYGALADCMELETINVDKNNENYSSVDGILFNKEKTELMCYPSAKSDLKYIIPNSVTNIDSFAFDNCLSLENITIPDSVVFIESYAFNGCLNLKELSIPNSVEFIGPYAFNGCISLTNIDVATDNEYYSSVDGVLFDKEKTELIRYPSEKTASEYIIPNSVEVIAPYAFERGLYLTNITIPNSVTNIYDYAFYYCLALTNITIPENVEYIGSDAFYECLDLVEVTLLCRDVEIADNAFGYYSVVYDVEYGDFNDYAKIDGFKIYCYAGTAGEQYAIENGFNYELLDDIDVTLDQIDINGDGKISTADVGLVNAHAKSTKLLSGEALEKADINKDGKVTTADVGLINAYAKGTKKYS